MAKIQETTPIIRLLEGLGYEAKSHGVLMGKSGVEHNFGVVATKIKSPAEKLVVDVAVDIGEVDECAVIALFAKSFDAKPNKVFLIAMPRLNLKGKELAEHYGIRVIEAEDMKYVTPALEKELPS